MPQVCESSRRQSCSSVLLSTGRCNCNKVNGSMAADITKETPHRSPSSMPSARRIRLALLFACSLICPSISVQGQSGSISAVTYPAELFPGEHFTFRWAFTPEDGHATTTGDLTSFDIEVGRCWEDGSNVAGCSCDDADFELSLCLREEGCVDSDGSVDLVLPYDLIVTATYLLRVSLTADRAAYGCGDPLLITRRPGTGAYEGDGSSTPDNFPTLTAFAPEDSPWPGQAFTALWHYEETIGDGGAAGYFAVELFSCAAGSCEDDRRVTTSCVSRCSAVVSLSSHQHGALKTARIMSETL